MLNYLGPGNRTGILRFLGMEDNMGAYYILMGNVADDVGGGTTLTDPKDIAAFQQSLAAPDYFAGINFTQFGAENCCPGGSLSLADKTGQQVLEAKETILGKLWGTIEPRTWKDQNNGLTYNVDADGKITGIRPLMGDAPVGPVGALKGGKAVYSVYQGIENGVVKYVGITSRSPGLRFAEHAAAGGKKGSLFFTEIEGATKLTRSQARIMEQTLINQHGLQKNGGTLLNKIYSIARSKWAQYGIIIP